VPVAYGKPAFGVQTEPASHPPVPASLAHKMAVAVQPASGTAVVGDAGQAPPLGTDADNVKWLHPDPPSSVQETWIAWFGVPHEKVHVLSNQ
jgi:hypothetical protein